MTSDEKLDQILSNQEEIKEKLQDLEDAIQQLGDEVTNLGGGTGYTIEHYDTDEEG